MSTSDIVVLGKILQGNQKIGKEASSQDSYFAGRHIGVIAQWASLPPTFHIHTDMNRHLLFRLASFHTHISYRVQFLKHHKW